MDFKQFFEVQTNDCSNATFFMDYDSGELVYLNTAMEKKFQIFEEYTGKQASEVIPYFQDVCGYEDKTKLKNWESQESVFLSEMLNANFRSQVMVWEMEGRKFLQTKYFLAPNSDRRKEAEVLFEKAIARCLEILSNNKQNSPIASFLELLGEFYACQHAYILEFDSENKSVSKSYFWSYNQKMTSVPINPNVPMDIFVHWLENDHNKSIINLDKEVHDFKNFSIEEKILDEFNLDSVTFGKLWDKNGVLKGVVGLTNRADTMYDDRLLQAVSHFVMEQFSQGGILETIEDINDIDLLTGFYNREKYTEKLAELEKERPKSLGVLFVNLNGLKVTNEYLGYDAGDEQLTKTSSILNEYFYGAFYRVTGDEFVGFVPDCEEAVFEETVDTLQKRLKLQHHEASFSLGHSWATGSFTISEQIKIADTVMVINKQSFYAESLKDSQKITNTMLQDLFRAISEDEFLVYLQPQINLNTEEVVGAEALVRRFDKRNNQMIFPDSFIPLYEKNSVIRHVDLFVLRKVCKILKSWQGKAKPISVNFSRVTLIEHGIVKTIADIIDEYGVPHDLIIIEITERIGLIENDVATSLVEEFKNNGFRISLDDFGCAYSNIVTLAQIEFDEVKIDKSLVDDLITNPKNRVIVKNMLLMCHELENTHTLAEGIETKEQADYLRSVNCHLRQGYYYAKPMPNEEFFEKYIK